MIRPNRLLKWERGESCLIFLWPSGRKSRITCSTPDLADLLSQKLSEALGHPKSKEALIEDWEADGIPQSATIIYDMLKNDVLAAADGASAAEARSFHDLMERDAFRPGLTDQFRDDLLGKAYIAQAYPGEVQPLAQAPFDLATFFTAGRSSQGSRSSAISEEEISTLLALAYGRRKVVLNDGSDSDFNGTTGSGGGFYPIRIVLISSSGLDAQPPFALEYQRATHGLKKLDFKANPESHVQSMQDFVAKNQVNTMVSLMVDLEWSQQKYGNHAYRFGLLEAGAIMQNIRLACPRLGLENWPCGTQLGPWHYDAIPACKGTIHAVSIGLSKG